MIFITVGNWHRGFDRLVKAVDELKRQNIIDEDVIGQIGPGSYKPQFIKYCDYCSYNEFIEYLSQAHVIISHAGMGTIGQAIRISKPVIVVPRKSSLGEHFDDHQFITTKYMESEGKILVAYDVNDLPQKLKEAETFIPVKGYGSEEILKVVKEFIDNIALKKSKKN